MPAKRSSKFDAFLKRYYSLSGFSRHRLFFTALFTLLSLILLFVTVAAVQQQKIYQSRARVDCSSLSAAGAFVCNQKLGCQWCAAKSKCYTDSNFATICSGEAAGLGQDCETSTDHDHPPCKSQYVCVSGKCVVPGSEGDACCVTTACVTAGTFKSCLSGLQCVNGRCTAPSIGACECVAGKFQGNVCDPVVIGKPCGAGVCECTNGILQGPGCDSGARGKPCGGTGGGAGLNQACCTSSICADNFVYQPCATGLTCEDGRCKSGGTGNACAKRGESCASTICCSDNDFCSTIEGGICVKKSGAPDEPKTTGTGSGTGTGTGTGTGSTGGTGTTTTTSGTCPPSTPTNLTPTGDIKPGLKRVNWTAVKEEGVDDYYVTIDLSPFTTDLECQEGTNSKKGGDQCFVVEHPAHRTDEFNFKDDSKYRIKVRSVNDDCSVGKKKSTYLSTIVNVSSGVVTEPLSCAPDISEVLIGQNVTFTATGGPSTTYNWTAQNGTPQAGTGPTFTTAFNFVGEGAANVTSGTVVASCSVSVLAQPPPPPPTEPPPPPPPPTEEPPPPPPPQATATPPPIGGGPTSTPVPTAPPGATATPTTKPGATATPLPTAPGGGQTSDISLELFVRFQGILDFTVEDVLNAKVTLVAGGGQVRQEQTIEFFNEGFGFWSGFVTFTGVPERNDYILLIKGEKHVQKKICDEFPIDPQPGFYHCTSSSGNIALFFGENFLDFSGTILLAGDLAPQDGVIDSFDFSFIRQNLGSQDPAILKVADLNLDGIVDSQDHSLVIESLRVKYDEF